MKQHKVTLVVVGPEGMDIDRMLCRVTKHSDLVWWIEGDPEVTDYEGDDE